MSWKLPRKARALAQEVESKAYALTDELRQLQKDERMSTQQKAQRAREIAKKESEKLFMGTEVVHNPVKEFVPLKEVKVGQEVCIAELNQLATVLSLPDKTAMFSYGPASSRRKCRSRASSSRKAGQGDETPDQGTAALLPPRPATPTGPMAG